MPRLAPPTILLLLLITRRRPKLYGTVEYLIVMQEGVKAWLAAEGNSESAMNERRPAGNAERKVVGGSFWARWVLATLLGLLIGLVAFVAVGVTAGDAIDGLPDFVFGSVLGFIFGTTFGTTQWRVLRRHVGPAASWVGATLVGFIVGGSIIFGLMNGSDPDTSLITKLGHGIVLGASLGVAQWLVLRGRLDEAKMWIAISTLSWVAAELVGVVLTGVVGDPLNLVGLFLVGGVLPGGGMMWLLRRALRKA